MLVQGFFYAYILGVNRKFHPQYLTKHKVKNLWRYI